MFVKARAFFGALFSIALMINSGDGAALVIETDIGQQYASAFIAAEINSREFLRRLYDPLRPIVTTNSCPIAPFFDTYFDTCCDDFCIDAFSLTLTPWLEAGGGAAVINANKCHGNQVRFSRWQVTGGGQASGDDLTIGIAGSYDRDKIKYKSHGSGREKTGYVALYGVYRPCGWYVLADLGFGYTKNSVRRNFEFNSSPLTAQGSYKIKQVLGYIEGGFDICFRNSLLQPFLGFERNYFDRNGFRETGASPFNLSVDSRTFNATYSRLGLHITTDVDWFSSCYCNKQLSLSFDVAWTYRLSKSQKRGLTGSFESSQDTIAVQTVKNNRNGIDSALTLTTDLCYGWKAYAEAIGLYWGKTLSYSFLGGLSYSW